MTTTTRYRVIIAALSAVVLVLVAALAWSTTTTPDQPATTAPPSVAPSTPSFNESVGDAGHDDHATDEDPNEAAWRPVVENFGRNFTNVTGGAGPWRARLTGDPQRPSVTSEVATQLGTVDVANVPVGAYAGYEIEKTSAYEAAVTINYREDWSMVLSLITDGTNWQVYAYDQSEQ